MTLQKTLSYLRRCDTDFHLIESDDRIAVGLSGGKDSVALVAALAAYRRFCTHPFTLCAVTVDNGMGADFSPLSRFLSELDVPYHIVKTDIGEIVFNVRKEKNPCSLCAKMRRGALDGKLNELGCNVLALGHNADDIVETFFLSMIYEGRLSTFSPSAFMDRSGIKLIRPLLYMREGDTAAFVRDAKLPTIINPCPANGNTKRETIKNMLSDMCNISPSAFERIHSAIMNPERYNLLQKPAPDA